MVAPAVALLAPVQTEHQAEESYPVAIDLPPVSWLLARLLSRLLPRLLTRLLAGLLLARLLCRIQLSIQFIERLR